jgi:hypothetical protein
MKVMRAGKGVKKLTLSVSPSGRPRPCLELDVSPKIRRQLALVIRVPAGWGAVRFHPARMLAITNVGMRISAAKKEGEPFHDAGASVAYRTYRGIIMLRARVR